MSDIDALSPAKAIETVPCTDCRYFKFKAINAHLLKSLCNSQLYFANPEKLNDPFDCRLDLRQAFERAASSASETRKQQFLKSALKDGEKFLDNWPASFQDWGIACFSREMSGDQSTLMWSHYADEHRGVCLLYRFPKSFLDLFYVDNVSYADNRLTDWLAHEAPLELGSFEKELARIYLTTKSSAWKYETEARIIRSKCGLLHIPSGYLEQVCFGLNASQEDIDCVTKLAHENCGCSKFCQIVRSSDSEFGLDTKKL